MPTSCRPLPRPNPLVATRRAARPVTWQRGAELLLVCLLFSGCKKAESAKKPEPPKIAAAIHEHALTTIELSKESERRLKLLAGLTAVERRTAPRRRTVAGEVALPPGQSIIVSAPLSGMISASGAWPIAGQKVSAGDPLCSFTPLLDPAERIRIVEAGVDAQRQIEFAKVQVEAARVALARAKQLLESKVGNQRAVEEAEAAFNLAQENLKTAETRYSLVGGESFVENSGAIAARTISAPIGGVISKVDVAPEESVPQGAPLFEIGRYDSLWIRVPIYVGRWRDIDLAAPATIKEFGAPPRDAGRLAKPAAAPPGANPAANTVDLFFELPNENGQLQPGQKLSATLTLRGSQESLVAPWSAIVYDTQGGAWVYEHHGPQTYARRRVVVRQVDHAQGLAMLDSGPAVGAKVVTGGAAELFGIEFGLSK